MKEMKEVVIVEALRTPVCKRGGKLSTVRADDLVVTLLNEVVRRTKVNPLEIEDVLIGCNTQIGECALDVARTSVLASDLPYDIPGVSINRQCASGMQAVQFAAMEIMTGNADIAIGGGVEKQSKYPIMMDAQFPEPTMPNPKIMKKYRFTNQGVSAEMIAKKYNLTKEQLDKFALWSHQKAVRAIQEGRFKREILPIEAPSPQKGAPPVIVDTDEGPRPDTSLEKMAALKPAFMTNGIITAANSCPTNDGACVIMLMSREKAQELGLKARATIKSMAFVGVDPVLMLLGPTPSMKKALKRAGMTLDQMEIIECNEAFSPVVLATGIDLGVDFSSDPRLNPNGGAIALGHPTGCSGARLMTTLLHELERTNKKYGIAALCVGFGMGIATIIERGG